MSKPEQVLVIEPAQEMRFRGPFKDVVAADLTLSNPTDKRVCFKVKTTAPKRYCVRPNSGLIEGHQSVTVSVMLQPFEYDPNEKNKHKFMVQSMFAPEGNVESHETMWKNASPDMLMDSKLKCVFELPVGTPAAAPSPTNNLDPNISEEDNLRNVNIAKQTVKQATPEKQMPTPKASNVETELKKFMEENKRLQNEIAELRKDNSKLKDDGVRLRKLTLDDTVSSSQQSSHPVAQVVVEEPGLNQMFQMPQVIFLVIAIILGLIVGKLIL